MINKGCRGEFRVELLDNNGEVLSDSKLNSNLIVDGALDFKQFPEGTTYLCLGSGVVTAPSITDTALGNQIAAINFPIVSNTNRVDDPQGQTISKTGTRDFQNIVGDITELGLRVGSASGKLITRALIKDQNGSPTAITVAEGQTLRLTYMLFWYLPDFVASGITPTPHGDLHWEVVKSGSGLDPAQVAFGFRDAHYGQVMGASAAGSYSVDIPNRTKTIVLTKAAVANDTVLPAGGVFAYIQYSSGYVVKLTQPYTLPANWDLTVTLQNTWGRLP